MSLSGQRACVGVPRPGHDVTSRRTGPTPAWTTLPPCSTLKPARSGFRKVSSSTESDSCPIPGLAEGVLEMRVKEGSKIRNILGFAMARMQGGVRHDGGWAALNQIVFTGSGRAITKTISCAEIMKRQIRGLHQVSKLHYRTVQEQWEGRDGSCSRMTIHRMLPAIYILLSKEPLDPKEPGYQPPVQLDTSEPQYQCPVELDLNKPEYQHPGELDLNKPDYQRPVELQALSESRKSERHFHSPLDPQSMLGYHPPAEPYTPSHPRQPAEPLLSPSSLSQSGAWPSGEFDAGSDSSKTGYQPSAEPRPPPHLHRAGEELCSRVAERNAHRQGSRKRHAGPCALSSQPPAKAALFDEGNS